MSKGFTDRMIDAVIRAHQLEDGATLVPRWCLRWSVNLTVLALGEFLLATLITFARGFYVAGAIVASIGGGWLLVYVLYLAICYVMVYQSQTRLFQSIYRCPFWHGLAAR